MALFQNIFSKLSRTSQSQKPATASQCEIEPYIILTEENLVCSYPSKNATDKITWENINSIDVLTTDEGPYVCDVFILISDNIGGVAIPQDREECKLIIDRIFKLPGFDFNEFTTAMGSTENKRFNVWKRE